MHVAIEMDQLRVTHVHPEPKVISGLLYLESANIKSVRTESIDDPLFLSTFSQLELNLLYRNLTNTTAVGSIELIVNEIRKLAPRRVDFDELISQIAHVIDELEAPIGKGRQFQYVFGANVPAEAPLATLPFGEPLIAKPGHARIRAHMLPAARANVQAATTAGTVAPAPAARAAPAMPRGTPRPITWALADEVWEAAGKPTDPAIVLQLRRTMMQRLLDEKQIGKTYSSSELGRWMKDRLQII